MLDNITEAEAANMKVAELKSEVVAKKKHDLQQKQNEEVSLTRAHVLK